MENKQIEEKIDFILESLVDICKRLERIEQLHDGLDITSDLPWLRFNDDK